MNTSETTPLPLPRRLMPTWVLFLISAGLALVTLWFFYGLAWRIPGLRELRGNTLRFTLWLLASPLVGLAVGWARRATWRSVARACVICIVTGMPVTWLGGAVHRVRASSRESAVYCNLGALAAAADQYWLEHSSKAELRYEDLVGPARYVKALNPISGEDYRSNFPLRMGDHLRAKLSNGSSVVYYSQDPRADARNGDEESPHDAEGRPRKRIGAPVKAENRSAAGSAAPDKTWTATQRQERREALCASCHARK